MPDDPIYDESGFVIGSTGPLKAPQPRKTGLLARLRDLLFGA